MIGRLDRLEEEGDFYEDLLNSRETPHEISPPAEEDTYGSGQT